MPRYFSPGSTYLWQVRYMKRYSDFPEVCLGFFEWSCTLYSAGTVLAKPPRPPPMFTKPPRATRPFDYPLPILDFTNCPVSWAVQKTRTNSHPPETQAWWISVPRQALAIGREIAAVGRRFLQRSLDYADLWMVFAAYPGRERDHYDDRPAKIPGDNPADGVLFRLVLALASDQLR